MRKTLKSAVQMVSAFGVGAAIVWLVKGGAVNAPSEIVGISEPGSRASESAPTTSAARAAGVPLALREEPRRERAADPNANTLVFGTVTGTDGDPLPASVRLEDEVTGDTYWSSAAENGEFAVTGLHAGAWLATAQKVGFIASRRSLHVAAGESQVRQDFVLDPEIRIPVRLQTPDGERLSSAISKLGLFVYWGRQLTVIATPAPPGDRLRMLTTEPQGMGRADFHTAMTGTGVLKGLPDDVDGLLCLRARPPISASLVLCDHVLATQTIAPETQELRLVLDPEVLLRMLGSFAVRVVDDASGAPVTKGFVALNTSYSGGDGRPLDKDGRVLLERRLPGNYELVITSESYAPYQRKLVLEPGKNLDGGTVRLARNASVRGRVVTRAGKPVQAQVSVMRADASDYPRAGGSLATKSRPDGTFEIGVAPGQYWFLVSEKPWATHPVEVDASGGGVDGVSIVLDEGIPVTFVSPAGLEERMRVVVRDANDRVVWGSLASEWNPLLHVLLGRGKYRVSAEDATGRRGSSDFEVGDKPARVNIPN